jgi:hypothetical protein
VSFQCITMLANVILEDSVNERNLYMSVKCLVVYVPGRVSNVSENFRLIHYHDCYIGFTGAPHRTMPCNSK